MVPRSVNRSPRDVLFRGDRVLKQSEEAPLAIIFNLDNAFGFVAAHKSVNLAPSQSAVLPVFSISSPQPLFPPIAQLINFVGFAV